MKKKIMDFSTGDYKAHCDSIYYDDKGNIQYISLVGSTYNMDGIANEFKKYSRNRFRISNRYKIYTGAYGYNAYSKKFQGTDYIHMIFVAKDERFFTKAGEKYKFTLIQKEDDNLHDLLFNKLKEFSKLPILRSWMEYLTIQSRQYGYLVSTSQLENRNADVDIYSYEATSDMLEYIISHGLKTGKISVEGSNDKSDRIERDIVGIDDYLACFGETLAVKTQNSFRAKFDITKDSYSNMLEDIDDYIYDNTGITLYEAQRTVIQAVSNNLDINDSTFVIGEMGTGKTLQGSAIPYVHHAKRHSGFNAVVMCPSHLTKKWKSEIERFVPNSRAYIVNDFMDLLKLERRLKTKFKIENTYVIMSKDRAKIGFDTRPAAVWSERKKAFVCPECGQELYVYKKVDKKSVKVPFDMLDMKKEYKYNMKCMNHVEKWDNETKKYRKRLCNAKLWTPLNRDDKNTAWIKLGSEGWIMKRHIEQITNDMIDSSKTVKMTTSEKKLFTKIMEQYNKLQNDEEVTSSYKGSKKYPVTKYIREKMKDVFDYAIIDECHQYKSQSIQGQAAADLIQGCKKSILLTGTLLNGYADGLFYLLYRTCPRLMLNAGYAFSDEARFAKDYGVMQDKQIYQVVDGRYKVKSSKPNKRLPGVSPLMFSKFLLNNSVFLSLSDMAEGLPGYKEIPLAVELDEDVKEGYQNIEYAFKKSVGGKEKIKYTASFINAMVNYPDAPHCAKPVYDGETGELLHEPEILNKEVRNKEKALIDLVCDKVDAGEKVLVYYSSVNTTDIAANLIDKFKVQGLKPFELKSNVKADSREEYINAQLEKGANVMICNPALVETGLDLLEFTTIVFYQLGYSIFTMRQASRRSWRLSQDRDVEVYFMYYKDTIQEQILSLMATKLHASLALEGKFSEEGLRAMSDNQDIMSKVASNLMDGIKETINENLFKPVLKSETKFATLREHSKTAKDIEQLMTPGGFKATTITEYIYKDRERELNAKKKFDFDINKIFA